MPETIRFEAGKNVPGINLGDILWVDYYPDKTIEDFIKIPLVVIKVYEDGSWDGEIEEAEA